MTKNIKLKFLKSKVLMMILIYPFSQKKMLLTMQDKNGHIHQSIIKDALTVTITAKHYNS